MGKEEMIAKINSKYDELKASLEGDDLGKNKELTLELHAMVDGPGGDGVSGPFLGQN